MKDEIWLIEASLFQFQNAASSIEDETMAMPLRLGLGVLRGAVEATKEGVNPARVNEIAFALNDVAGAVEQLPASDYERVAPALKQLQNDVEALKGAIGLPQDLVGSIRALQVKLKTRRTAIERQTMVEGEGVPLPHPPQELCTEAIPIRTQLRSAGFSTPALDAFIEDPASLRFHSINDIVDELDVIVG